MDAVKIDLNKYDLSENLNQDRSKWRNKIHVTDLNVWDEALFTMMMISFCYDNDDALWFLLRSVVQNPNLS